MPRQLLDTSGQDFYQNAFTLIDLPPKDLPHALPELSGLQPAANQEGLPRLLGEVARNVQHTYQGLTTIVADEQVRHALCDLRGEIKTTGRQEFRYMLIAHHEVGEEQIEEYRAGLDGNPAQANELKDVATEGFASLWAIFYPANLTGSRFRYLGLQTVSEHTTNVIGFAEKPDWAQVRGLEHVGPEGQAVVVLYQGVVWCDAATKKILKMRADLLKPRLDVKLELLTIEINFDEVHFSDAAHTTAWVPEEVAVTTVWNGQVIRDEHLYSNYALPEASHKVLASPKTKR
ncbi:MAG TPA: hypothetical protein VI455_18985 [Terriglobia bacterium]